jgi:hypothetical protein
MVGWMVRWMDGWRRMSMGCRWDGELSRSEGIKKPSLTIIAKLGGWPPCAFTPRSLSSIRDLQNEKYVTLSKIWLLSLDFSALAGGGSRFGQSERTSDATPLARQPLAFLRAGRGIKYARTVYNESIQKCSYSASEHCRGGHPFKQTVTAEWRWWRWWLESARVERG